MGDGNQEDAVERGEEGAECCVSIEGSRGMIGTEGMGTALVSLFLLSNGTVLCARYGWRVMCCCWKWDTAIEALRL